MPEIAKFHMLDDPQGQAAGASGIRRVGVVGLGQMGNAFAVNLVEDG